MFKSRCLYATCLNVPFNGLAMVLVLVLVLLAVVLSVLVVVAATATDTTPFPLLSHLRLLFLLRTSFCSSPSALLRGFFSIFSRG